MQLTDLFANVIVCKKNLIVNLRVFFFYLSAGCFPVFSLYNLWFGTSGAYLMTAAMREPGLAVANPSSRSEGEVTP